jgi:hypothetical protein
MARRQLAGSQTRPPCPLKTSASSTPNQPSESGHLDPRHSHRCLDTRHQPRRPTPRHPLPKPNTAPQPTPRSWPPPTPRSWPPPTPPRQPVPRSPNSTTPSPPPDPMATARTPSPWRRAYPPNPAPPRGRNGHGDGTADLQGVDPGAPRSDQVPPMATSTSGGTEGHFVIKRPSRRRPQALPRRRASTGRSTVRAARRARRSTNSRLRQGRRRCAERSDLLRVRDDLAFMAADRGGGW